MRLKDVCGILFGKRVAIYSMRKEMLFLAVKE